MQAAQDVEQGKATAEDMLGNDLSDRQATEGMDALHGGLTQIADAYAKRQEEYVSFMNRIHIFICAMLAKSEQRRGTNVTEKFEAGQQKKAYINPLIS